MRWKVWEKLRGLASSPVCSGGGAKVELAGRRGVTSPRDKHKSRQLERHTYDELSSDKNDHRSRGLGCGLGVHGGDAVLDSLERETLWTERSVRHEWKGLYRTLETYDKLLDDGGGTLDLLSLEREHRVVALRRAGGGKGKQDQRDPNNSQEQGHDERT